MTATLKVDTIKEVNSSVNNLVLDSSGNVTVGNNLTVTGTTTQTGSTTFTAQTLFPDGSVSAPSISNTGDVNTGVYFPAADNVAIATGGVAALTADSSQNVSVTNTLVMGSSFRRNAVINGAMNVWQRGTTFTNPVASGAFYTADRMGVNRAGDATGVTVSRSTSAPTAFQYSLDLQRTAGNTGTQGLFLYYSAETVDSIRFASKNVILSFYAKAGANYSGGSLSIIVNTGTGTDERVYAYTGSATVIAATQAINTTWTRYTFTTSSAVASNVTEIGFYIFWTPTGTAGADDAVYLTGIQLEVGSVATPYERQIYSDQLLQCQRYYQIVVLGYVGPATSGVTLNGNGYTYVPAVRTSPTITWISSAQLNSFPNTSGTTGGVTSSGFFYYKAANGTNNSGASYADTLSVSAEL